jgi:CBS domain containing-hemolysin-like protein
MADSTLALDLLKLIGVAFLVLANAFFVAAEFSLVSVRRTRINELLEQGNAAARWVSHAIEDPDKVIAATQLGITLSSLGLGWIGEPALAHLLEPIVNLVPPGLRSGLSHTLSAGIAFAAITCLHVVVGELAPKSIALQNPERTSLIVARPTLWTERLFKPFIWALNGAGNALLRMLGVSPASGHELVHSVEELKMLVTASAVEGVVEGEEEEILHAVFDFGDTLVRQVMIPRTEMIAVPVESALDDLIQVAVDHPFTKLPVFEGSQDHVVGVVHLKDILTCLGADNRGSITARDLMREALFVPETARIISLLERFRLRHQHIAIVLDEYGGTAGVVTLEDLIEEIVGEVSDPFDAEPDIQLLDDGTTLVDGLTLIEEINERLNLKLSDPDYDTIAGFVLGRLGRMAAEGDTVIADGVQLRVEAMDGRRIDRISITSLAVAGSRPAGKRRQTS